MLKLEEKIKAKHILTISSFIIITLLSSPALTKKTTEAPARINEKAERQRQDQAEEKRKRIIQEAAFAINETKIALKALEENRINDALAALEHATGKLEIILARDPQLKLAPVHVSVQTIDLDRNLKEIKSALLQIETLLFNGRIQDARELLNTLASEMIIKVMNIPLSTYPPAMTSAAALAEKGEIEAAKDTLQKALNTLIITQTIIPLPLSNVQALLLESERIANKTDRSSDDNQQLESLLKAALSELEIAEVLGYGTRKDFKNLYEELDKIKEKTKGGKSGKGFFDKIKSYLSDILKSTQFEKNNK